MRVSVTKKNLDGRLSAEIRRQYPMVYNQPLTESFDKLTNSDTRSWALSTQPHIEALPQYKVAENGIPGLAGRVKEVDSEFIRFMEEQNSNAGFFTPYIHQAEAVESWSNGADLVVSTGTGSGKTECFLWPIAGHLHRAARREITSRSGKQESVDIEPVNSGAERGIKALILYPMNALVTDQLKRLRATFGKESVADELKGEDMERRFQFGQYTGRTQFHGSYAKSGKRTGSKSPKLNKAKKRFNNFLKIKGEEADPDSLFMQMMDLGMVPAKGPDKTDAKGNLWHDLEPFHTSELQGNYPLLTQEGDRELVFRHEMHNTGYSNLKDGDNPIITNTDHHGGTPDIMVTNYSMLEYMLKRPLEHGIFEDTKHWLAGNDNHLLLVLDEAHLYQGALGTEVGYLIRRLLASLDIADKADKVQFILTSASLGDEKSTKSDFVTALTGRQDGWTFGSLEENKQFVDSGDCEGLSKSTVFIDGTRWIPETGPEWKDDSDDKSAKDSINLPSELVDYVAPIIKVFMELDGIENDDDGGKFHLAWRTAYSEDITHPTIDPNKLRETPLFRAIYGLLFHEPIPLNKLGEKLFGEMEENIELTEELLNFLASVEATRPNSDRILPILGVRAHLIYRGLPTLYWNISKEQVSTRCPGRGDIGYPLRGCRRCGAPYLSVWMDEDKFDEFSYVEDEQPNLIPVFQSQMNNSVRIEIYLADEGENKEFSVEVQDGRVIPMDGLPHIWVNTNEFTVAPGPSKPKNGTWRPGYLPTTSFRIEANHLPQFIDLHPENANIGQESNIQRLTFSKSTCIQCKTNHSRRMSDQITDYMTRGDNAFSKLINQLLKEQKPDKENPNPNQGRKTMAFSDSRSRAARLARRIQDDINLDEQRMLVLHLVSRPWFKNMAHNLRTIDKLYTWFILHLMENRLEPFANIDTSTNPRRRFAMHRIQLLSGLLAAINSKKDKIDAEQLSEYHELFASHIESIGEEIPLYVQALRNYILFVDSLPRGTTLAGEHKQDLGVKSLHAYASGVRNWVHRVLTNGLKYDGGEITLSAKHKKLVTGTVLSPLTWAENGETLCPDHQKIIDLVNGSEDLPDGYGFKVDSAELKSRLELLFPSNGSVNIEAELRDHSSTKLALKKEPKNENNLQYAAQRMVQWAIDRIKQRRTNFSRNQTYEQLLYYFQSTPFKLTDLAKQAKCLRTILLNLESRVQPRVWSEMEILTNLNTPSEFAAPVMDFLGSKDFSISSLGLGQGATPYELCMREISRYLEDKHFPPEEISELQAQWTESGLETILNEFVHWMTRPALSEDDSNLYSKQAYSGAKCVRDESSTSYNSYNAKAIGNAKYDSTLWGIPLDGIRTKLSALLDNITTEKNEIEEFIETQMLTDNIDNEGGDKRKLLKSKFVEIITLNRDEIGVCPQCVIAFPMKTAQETTKCPGCAYSTISLLNESDNEAINQRLISPWRDPMDKILGDDSLNIMIVRAEEHTAQINTSKDDSEMYTSAEEFELLFQDIPYVIPEDEETWTPPQSPIDVLSCTTTMEVGIDIGSLTTVALRTVPREPANYQQRVGRAGRGRSEVCIALSWCDNQPHAQNMFHNPLRTLSHPSNSPVIYMENETIMKRHVNAALLQAFFKRLKYDRELRKFPEFTESTMENNLMESMGTTGEFFRGTKDNIFSLERMKKWKDGSMADGEGSMTYSESYEQIVAMIGDPNFVEASIDNLLEDLNDIQEEFSTLSTEASA
jgi:ATP-dependent helicase YprA (DUF1998 family)